MDSLRFDCLTRSISAVLSRRTLAGACSLGALSLPSLVEAKKKHKKRKKKKKVKRNEFGCVNVGDFCKNNGQCCSGICQGKKDKKKCKAHDQSTCLPAQNVTDCGGSANVPCTATDGTSGDCFTTTGQGEFCSGTAICAICATDADCRAICDTTVACFVCPGCAGSEPGNVGTGCAFVDTSGCT